MQANVIECRICLEPTERKKVIAPCACSGSSRYVHRECLDRWRCTNSNNAFTRCSTCLKEYEMFYRDDSNYELNKQKRRMKYRFLVARDIFILLTISQVVIVSMAIILFVIDKICYNSSLSHSYGGYSPMVIISTI